MNKPKQKYRIGWPTNVTVSLTVWFCLLLALCNAWSGDYVRMIDNLCFIAVLLCYWHECYLKTKALNVARETISINEDIGEINTKLAEHTKAALAAYDSAERKVNGMKNAVRVAANLLRLERALRKQMEIENGKLREKLEAYEAKLGKAEGEIERLNKELKNIINTECNNCGDCAKFGKDCNAGDVDGAEDNQACEKFISKEVAELRECLKEACDNVCFKCRFGNVSYPYYCGNNCDRMAKWRKALEGATK